MAPPSATVAYHTRAYILILLFYVRILRSLEVFPQITLSREQLVEPKAVEKRYYILCATQVAQQLEVCITKHITCIEQISATLPIQFYRAA